MPRARSRTTQSPAGSNACRSPQFQSSAVAPRRHSLYSPPSSVNSKHQNPNNVSRKIQQPPNKNLLKARDAVKHLSSLSPALSPAHNPQLSQNQAIGTVASARANFMRVIVHSSAQDRIGVELLCVVTALLKKIKRRVSVGDKVLVGSIDWVDGGGMIENVFERKSEILDPPVANVNHLLVFFSLEQLTRFLVEAESTGIPPTPVLNKMELVDEETLITWKSRHRGWGYEPVFCSVETNYGLDTIQFILRETTSVIVRPSGVGKSSLINALRSDWPVTGSAEGDDWLDPILGSNWFEDLRVGKVSIRSGKGKHATRHVSLLPLSGGYLADTPGFFPEVQKMLRDNEPDKCLFNNCLHLGERGCIVKGDWERLPYYFQLHD